MLNFIDKLKPYSIYLLRIGLGIVFLWFGFNQVFDSNSWTSYLPEFISILPIEAKSFVLLNGIMEIIFGTLLILGLFTRISSLILSLHLFGIAFSLGYTAIGVRDFGLAIATLVIFFHGEDDFSLDNILKKNK